MTVHTTRIAGAVPAGFVTLALAITLGASRAEAATIVLQPLGDHTTSAVTGPCRRPNEPAAIDAAFFRVPEIARGTHVSGESLVRIDLDATGKVRGASMKQSSGNRWLDLAAMDSAHLSRYRPEVQNCKQVAGSYLVAVNFTEDDVR